MASKPSTTQTTYRQCVPAVPKVNSFDLSPENPDIEGKSRTARDSGVPNELTRKENIALATSVTAPMVGKILRIEANPGQAVEEDDVVIVMEAMKMEIPVVAPANGTVKAVNVEVGQSVEAGEELAEIE